jgi:hypothetical protein
LAFSDTREKKNIMIKDLETMEKIVANNSNLSWDGWNVVELIPSNSAMFKTDGAFVNNKWNTKKVYSYAEEGWAIPKKYVR